MKKVLLVDFMYLWNRMYHAVPESYLDKLKLLIERLHISSMYHKKIIVLDGVNGTHSQKLLLESYKAGRESKVEVYKQMNAFVKEMSAKCPSVLFVTSDNHEADEVIASFVPFYNKRNIIHIYSGDKDLIQLCNYENTFIGSKYTGGLNLVPLTMEEMLGKFEKATQGRLKDLKDLTKFRTFRGDSSDNIPAAIPRITTKVIFDIIEKCWSEDEPLTSQIAMKISDYFENSNKILEHSNDILRNWKLMNLRWRPFEQILRETRRLK